MKNIEIDEDIKNYELEKFKRDQESHRNVLYAPKEYNFMAKLDFDSSFVLFFYNLMDLQRRRVLITVHTLFKDAAFNRKFRK